MTNEEFIHLHRREDTRKLALQCIPDGVDVKYCLQQIDGWQVACRKLPLWAATDGLLYPPRLAMEQCSSEQTACYKRDIVMRLLPPEECGRRLMADFTGGFGVDFSFLAPCFDDALYVERQEALCAVARHNFPLLGLTHARVVCADVNASLPLLQQRFSFLFLDPARRDEMGKKIVLVEDCSPNVRALHDVLLRAAPLVMVKLSPMLDIAAALRELPSVAEVHVVSVEGECKELLLVLRESDECRLFCVNLGSSDPCFSMEKGAFESMKNIDYIDTLPENGYLFEPNASILKAGVQDALCSRLQLDGKLHPHSHLYVSRRPVADFPGRSFRIVGWSGFDKRGLKSQLHDVTQANLTLRNFPSTTEALRRRLHLREGGNVYLFATTLADGSHILVRCEKI